MPAPAIVTEVVRAAARSLVVTTRPFASGATTRKPELGLLSVGSRAASRKKRVTSRRATFVTFKRGIADETDLLGPTWS